jgi:hypothetical protein
LVERSAIGKMGLLGFCPAAKFAIDRNQFHGRKLAGIFCGYFGVARPVKVFRGEFLPFV